MKLGLGRRVLPILEIDDVEDIRPRALIAVYALGGAVAGAAVERGQPLGFDGLEEALRRRLSSY